MKRKKKQSKVVTYYCTTCNEEWSEHRPYSAIGKIVCNKCKSANGVVRKDHPYYAIIKRQLQEQVNQDASNRNTVPKWDHND